MTEAIRSALRDMLGPEVGISLTDPRAPEEGLLPEETPAMARAVPKRRREFAAGRRAARAAMAELDLPPAPVPQGPHREPLWPEGIVGSIAHCDTLCVAVVSRSHRTLGIDIEDATPLPTDLEKIVCTKAERAWLNTLPSAERGVSAKQIFSAKEAVYKAQFPLTGQVIGFQDVNLRFEPEQGLFEVEMNIASPTRTPRSGRVLQHQDMILSLCCLKATDTA